MEGNQKLLDLERKKKEAAEAVEAARKAAEEAKKREKELAEETSAPSTKKKVLVGLRPGLRPVLDLCAS